MSKFRKSLPPWWDRERDEASRPIRRDVRDAATNIWERVCAQIYRILGDFADAPELFEQAVQRVSRYLDKIGEPPTDAKGLLFVAVYRLARRKASRLERVESVGSLNELSNIAARSISETTIERRIFVDQILRALRPESRGILRLRLKGFSWEEIGDMMQIGETAARKRFWRDVRKAHSQLTGQYPASDAGPERQRDGKTTKTKPCY